MTANRELSEIVNLHRRLAHLVELAMLAGVGKTVLFDIEHGKQSVRAVLAALNISLYC